MYLTDFKLLAMDMDSTLITIECIDEIADYARVKAEVAAITESAMRGEIEWLTSFKLRVALLKGLDQDVLRQVYDERLALQPGAREMLEEVRQAGLFTMVVSGGFTYFTGRIQSELGLDYQFSNTLVVRDGKLTGEVSGEMIDAEGKARKVREVCAQLGVPTSAAIAVGDGANDLKMMAIAGASVAYHAKPVVQSAATFCINQGGLDQLPRFFENHLA